MSLKSELRDTWLAQWMKHVTLHLRVMGSSPTLDAELTLKGKKKKKTRANLSAGNCGILKFIFIHKVIFYIWSPSSDTSVIMTVEISFASICYKWP